MSQSDLEEKYAKIMFGDGVDPMAKPPSEKPRLVEAYEKAHEVRQFEIELYWKRALYFWGFETVFILAASNLFRMRKLADAFPYLLAVSIVAFVFTWLWGRALKGSKQWQENWELHIDLLENGVSGNLYKTVLYKPNHLSDFYSVSKVNEAMNELLQAMWAGVALQSIIKIRDVNFSQLGIGDVFLVCVFSVILVCCLFKVIVRLICSDSMLKTSFDGHDDHNINSGIKAKFR